MPWASALVMTSPARRPVHSVKVGAGATACMMLPSGAMTRRGRKLPAVAGVSGVVLLRLSPASALGPPINVAFAAKLLCLALIGLNDIVYFATGLKRHVDGVGEGADAGASAKIVAGVSVALWLAVRHPDLVQQLVLEAPEAEADATMSLVVRKMGEVADLGVPLVEVTGGEPLAQRSAPHRPEPSR